MIIVCQLFKQSTNQRSEPFSGTLKELALHFQEHLDNGDIDEESKLDDMVLVLMDDSMGELAPSFAPLLTIPMFVSIGLRKNGQADALSATSESGTPETLQPDTGSGDTQE